MSTQLSAPVRYYPRYWDLTKDPYGFAQQLWDELEWVDVAGNRREYYMSDINETYSYGSGSRVRIYQPQPWHPILKHIQEHLQEMLGVRLESCVVNGYANERHALGWHADDSPEMDNARPIAVVSYGAPREIWFRSYRADAICVSCGAHYGHSLVCQDASKRVALKGDTEKLLLETGSLLVMEPGMQLTHQHRIPKCSHACDVRVSLTFRGWKYKQ